jgi:hypothetical protein
VVVRAVADRPSVSIAGTGNEDTFVPVPITVALNDTDGSETLQQVVVAACRPRPRARGRSIDCSRARGTSARWSAAPRDTVSGTDSSGNSYTVVNNGSGRLTFTGLHSRHHIRTGKPCRAARHAQSATISP